MEHLSYEQILDEQILDELEIELKLKSTKFLTPLEVEERLISGFKENNVFYETHQRVPFPDDADILEELSSTLQ